MPTSFAEFRVAQTWIGSKETKVVFDERLDRLLPDFDERTKAFNASVGESLREQLAIMMLDRPSSMSAEGVSLSYSQNLIALQKMITRFESSGGTGIAGGAQVSSMHRQSTR